MSTKNRMYQENHARDCEEKQELRRICCEQSDRVRQLRIDELSAQKKENPSTMNQLLSQIQELQDRMKKIILWSWDSEQLWNVPRFQSTSENSSPRGVISRDSCLPHNTWNSWCAWGNVFEDLKGHPNHSSRIQGIWHHLLSNWDQVTPQIPWDMDKDWEENRRVQQNRLLDVPGIMRPGILCIILKELILEIVSWTLRGMLSRNCISENSQTRWRPVLESQLQDRRACEHTVPSTRNVVDRWSGDGKINRRSYHVAVN